MEYRKLGKTNLMVSEVGMGCEGFIEEGGSLITAFLDLAEQTGVNYIDLYLPNPSMRAGLGKALKGRREKFMLQAHICSIWENGQYKRTREIAKVEQSFEELFRLLDTPYLDVGMIHYVDSTEDWEEVANGPVMEYAKGLKQNGRIRHIGLSSHNPRVSLAAVNSGLVDVLMFSVNPCYDLQPAYEDVNDIWAYKSYDQELENMDAERQSLYETCQRLGVGITVMKAFGGGDLLDEKLSPAGKALTPYQCIHYALDRPAVATVLAGARTIAEMEKSIGYTYAPQSEKDYAEAFASFPRISWHGHCMYCSHCAPCPQQIEVADVTKFLNLARAQKGIPETVREHYAALAHHAGECIACGDCESRCPFGVKIIENMAEAASLFGY